MDSTAVQRDLEIKKKLESLERMPERTASRLAFGDPRKEVYLGYKNRTKGTKEKERDFEETDSSIDDISKDTLSNYLEKYSLKELSYEELSQTYDFENDPYVCKSSLKDWFDLPYDQDYNRILEVKKVELEILSELKRVADANGLKVYAIYGTLLGAIRNAGMLFGDDDIDVALVREDYDKLIELARGGAFKENYFLQTPENDDCFFGGYLKLRRSDTSAIDPKNWWPNCNEGIFIDIFPMDLSYGDEAKERQKRRKIKLYQRLLYAKAYGYSPRFLDMPLLIWKGYKYLGLKTSRETMARKLTEIFKSGDSIETTGKYKIYAHYMKKSATPMVFTKKALDNAIEVEYEGIKLLAPSNYDRLLEKRYGEEYMEPLEFDENKEHHGFYSASVPYENYKKRFGGLKAINSIDRPLVLIGDKRLIKAFKKAYPNKANSIALEIEDKNSLVLGSDGRIDEASAIDKMHEGMDKIGSIEGAYIIIASPIMRYIEDELRSKGYKEYYFYLNNRNWMLRANTSSVYKEIANLFQPF